MTGTTSGWKGRIGRLAASSRGHMAVAGLLGLAAGTGGYTFLYGKGASYLTNDPAACVNCHVMREQYSGWLQGSHRTAATCNDCHTPKGWVGKYRAKASNGFWHSFAFSTGRFAEPIRIKAHNREITEARCRSCHDDIVEAISTGWDEESVSCVRCHRTVGHRR